MFGLSPDQQYQLYLQWFQEQVKDSANWSVLRQDKDCANYTDLDSPPVPYARGEALFRMGNPKQMHKMIERYHERTTAKMRESYKHVGGNPDNPLLNPEYVRNMEVLKKTQEDLKRSYSVYAELTPKQIKESYRQQEAIVNPEPKWVELTFWQALKHWWKGGKIEEKPRQETMSVIQMMEKK